MEFLSIPACISVQLMYSVVMEQNKHLHTGRYAAIYQRGYYASIGNTYWKPVTGGGITGLVSTLEIYGTSNPTQKSVDDFTKGMGPKARAAFEDGWFDALEDNVTWWEKPRP